MLANEETIIERAKQNPKAFAPIFDAYYDTIFTYVLRRVPDAHRARDIVSEVFYKALTKLHSFTWQNISILHWLYRIASREIALYFRNPNQKQSSLDHLQSLNKQFASDSNIEEELLQAERTMNQQREFKALQGHILTLPLRDQEVLSLRFFEAKKIGEIAQILELSDDVAKATLYRAIKKLKKCVTNEQDRALRE